ncbi:hypothetical protein C2E20_6497 [Micractinium conductrix]|uniref:Uncharacterized protein n=1 Tax=Micractinium conductrix TaxID=554055 RepID=A0A2P6V7Q9_9CHLO|nr:hypothetical protein C2E20_6497 [Micractinium conductrix]|eukprot:PSC70127.1 hypothetical protein C2E20_6497 [Micractinium conductrix]
MCRISGQKALMAAMLALSALSSVQGARPTPAGTADDDAHRQLSLPTTAAHHRRRLAQQADASRQQQPHQEQQPHQQQQEEQQQQAAPPIEHQARAVALQCRFALEQHLVSLASSGLPLAQQAQQQAALDALSEEVEALATAVIAATQADVAGLHGELAQGGGLPKGADHADMAALLADGSFRDRLKDAHDDALLAVAAALEPHTQALAADVHAALAPLVLPPAALDPLPQYADSFLPAFTQAFAAGVVEATLLQQLWRD